VDLISGGTKQWLWRLAFTLLHFDKLTVPDDLEAFEMPRRGRLVLATDLGAGRLRLRRNSDSSQTARQWLSANFMSGNSSQTSTMFLKRNSNFYTSRRD
jgi:hypothetical protein